MENCLLLKFYRKLRKMFLSPRRELNPQPYGLWWDALTIELAGPRWQREGHDVYPGAHIRGVWGSVTPPPTIENQLEKLVPNCPSDIFLGPDRPVKILCNIRVQER